MNKERVYRLVRTALKNGSLIRPSACQLCGINPGVAVDGRSKIHAHHHDYSKPLDVEWLCAKCHREHTPLPAVMGAPCYGDSNGMRKHPEAIQGSKNGWAKLDECSVASIKARFTETVLALAKEFKVKPATIYDIRSGRTWKHVAAAPRPETK